MVAIKGMDMPKVCGDCKLCSSNYVCIPSNRDTKRDEKPDWCPLWDVKHIRGERIYPHEDIVMVPDEKLREYALAEIGKSIWKYIVDTPEARVIQSWPYSTDQQRDACCEMESDSVRVMADVWIVEPEVGAL